MHANCYVAVTSPQLFATLLRSMNNSNFIGFVERMLGVVQLQPEGVMVYSTSTDEAQVTQQSPQSKMTDLETRCEGRARLPRNDFESTHGAESVSIVIHNG